MGTARYPAVGPLHPPASSVLPRGTASLAIAVAAFCAASVFFLLCERDHSTLVQSIAPTIQGPLSVTSSTAATTSPASTQAALTEQVPFHIKKSKRFTRVGPVSVGVWTIDADLGFYNVSIVAEGERTNRKYAALDEPIIVALNQSNRHVRLVATQMDKDEVSGMLTVQP